MLETSDVIVTSPTLAYKKVEPTATWTEVG